MTLVIAAGKLRHKNEISVNRDASIMINSKASFALLSSVSSAIFAGKRNLPVRNFNARLKFKLLYIILK